MARSGDGAKTGQRPSPTFDAAAACFFIPSSSSQDRRTDRDSSVAAHSRLDTDITSRESTANSLADSKIKKHSTSLAESKNKTQGGSFAKRVRETLRSFAGGARPIEERAAADEEESDHLLAREEVSSAIMARLTRSKIYDNPSFCVASNNFRPTDSQAAILGLDPNERQTYEETGTPVNAVSDPQTLFQLITKRRVTELWQLDTINHTDGEVRPDFTIESIFGPPKNDKDKECLVIGNVIDAVAFLKLSILFAPPGYYKHVPRNYFEVLGISPKDVGRLTVKHIESEYGPPQLPVVLQAVQPAPADQHGASQDPAAPEDAEQSPTSQQHVGQPQGGQQYVDEHQDHQQAANQNHSDSQGVEESRGDQEGVGQPSTDQRGAQRLLTNREDDQQHHHMDAEDRQLRLLGSKSDETHAADTENARQRSVNGDNPEQQPATNQVSDLAPPAIESESHGATTGDGIGQNSAAESNASLLAAATDCIELRPAVEGEASMNSAPQSITGRLPAADKAAAKSRRTKKGTAKSALADDGEDASRRKSLRFSSTIGESPAPSNTLGKRGRDFVDTDGPAMRIIRRKQRSNQRLSEGERLILEDFKKAEEWERSERNKTIQLQGQTIEQVEQVAGLGKLPKGWAWNVAEEDMRQSKRARTTHERPAEENGVAAASKVRNDVSAPVQPAKTTAPNISRRKHQYLNRGLYVGQQQGSDPTLRPDQNSRRLAGQSGSAKPQNSVLPLPMFTGEALLERGRDFKLPYSIYGPSPGRGAKPDRYKKRSKNRYVGDAAQFWVDERPADRSLCSCTPKDPCGPHCLNRCLEYECDNSLCNVGEELCNNRQFTELKRRTDKGTTYEIGVEVHDYGSKGFGLRACRSFKDDQIIIEYSGEIITREESDRRRSTEYETVKNFYLLELDSNLIIDATRGSDARFVNHSCDPNCEMRKYAVDGKPRMALFAIRDVETGEELTYDYNYQSYGEPQTCLCGSDMCRGKIGPRGRDKDRPATTTTTTITASKPARASSGNQAKKASIATRDAPTPKTTTSFENPAPEHSSAAAPDSDSDVYNPVRMRQQKLKKGTLSRGAIVKNAATRANRRSRISKSIRDSMTDDEESANPAGKGVIPARNPQKMRRIFWKATKKPSPRKTGMSMAPVSPAVGHDDETTGTGRVPSGVSAKKVGRGKKRQLEEVDDDLDDTMTKRRPGRPKSNKKVKKTHVVSDEQPQPDIPTPEAAPGPSNTNVSIISANNVTQQTTMNFPQASHAPSTIMGRMWMGTDTANSASSAVADTETHTPAATANTALPRTAPSKATSAHKPSRRPADSHKSSPRPAYADKPSPRPTYSQEPLPRPTSPDHVGQRNPWATFPLVKKAPPPRPRSPSPVSRAPQRSESVRPATGHGEDMVLPPVSPKKVRKTFASVAQAKGRM